MQIDSNKQRETKAMMSQELFNTFQIIFALVPTIFLIKVVFFEKGDRTLEIMRARATLVWLMVFCGIEVLLYALHVTLLGKILVAIIMGLIWVLMFSAIGIIEQI
jgi:hypothetical protein